MRLLLVLAYQVSIGIVSCGMHLGHYRDPAARKKAQQAVKESGSAVIDLVAERLRHLHDGVSWQSTPPAPRGQACCAMEGSVVSITGGRQW
jgi:hypothetical protein